MDVDDDGWDLRELELAKQQSLSDSMDHDASIPNPINPKKRPMELELDDNINAKRFAPLAPEDESTFAPTRSSSSFGQLTSNRPLNSPSTSSQVEKNRSPNSNEKSASSSLQVGAPTLHQYPNDSDKSSPKQSETPSTPDSSDWSSTTLGLYDHSSNDGTSLNAPKKKQLTSDDEFNRQWEAALAQASAPGQSPEDEAESQRRLNEFLDRIQEKMDRDLAMDLQKTEETVLPKEDNPVSKPSTKIIDLGLAPEVHVAGPSDNMDVDKLSKDDAHESKQPKTQSGLVSPAPQIHADRASEDMDVDDLTLEGDDLINLEQPKTPPELVPFLDPRTPSTPEESLPEGGNGIRSSIQRDEARFAMFDVHFKLLANLAQKAPSSRNPDDEADLLHYQEKLDDFFREDPKKGPILSSSSTGLPSPSPATETTTSASPEKTKQRNQLTNSATLRSSRIISEDEGESLPVPSSLAKHATATKGDVPARVPVHGEPKRPTSTTSSASATATPSPANFSASDPFRIFEAYMSPLNPLPAKQRDTREKEKSSTPASASQPSPRNAEADPSETAVAEVRKVSTRLEPVRWTPEEEETLLRSAKANSYVRNGKYHFRWKDMEKDLPARSTSSLMQHFMKLRIKGLVPFLDDITSPTPNQVSKASGRAPSAAPGPKEKEKETETTSGLSSATMSTTAATKKTATPNAPKETQSTHSSNATAVPIPTAKIAASLPSSTLREVLPLSEPSPTTQAPVASNAMDITPEDPKETQPTQTTAPTAQEPEVRATPAQDALYEDEWEVF